MHVIASYMAFIKLTFLLNAFTFMSFVCILGNSHMFYNKLLSDLQFYFFEQEILKKLKQFN